MNKKMNVLLISAVSLNISAGLGNSVMKSLSDRGHQVDFITKYKFENMTSNMYSVYDEFDNNNTRLFLKIFNRIKIFIKTSLKNIFLKQYYKNGKYIFSFDERSTWVNSDLLLSKISPKYDFILVLFWNNFITAKTLCDIYQKYKKPILLCVADMLPMTGGCYYFGECKNYINKCGSCPAIDSKNPKDYTYYNLQYKKSVYSSINYYYGGNSWLSKYAQKSPIIDNTRIKRMYLPINENIFDLKDQTQIRKKLSIPESKKFVLFAGAADLEDERKGFRYLIEAINLFQAELNTEQRSEVLLILAGKMIPKENLKFEIDTLQFGFVNENSLANLYSASDVFLCSSIDDAGPTMINQAIMSGTPVISFNIGIAQDIIIDGKTGYKIKNKDSLEFSRKIKEMFRLNFSNKAKMKNTCRKIAIEKYSLSAFADRVENIYSEIIEVQPIAKS